MPWTPPPGGVDAEQRWTPGSGVAYGTRRATGRVNNWRTSCAPPLTSPPTKFGLRRSTSAQSIADRAATSRVNPGAKRSTWASIAAVMSRFEPFGTKYVRDWRVATVQTFDYQNHFGKLVEEHHPDLVILNLGANDAFVPNPKSLAPFVERIVKKATASGAACFWITPPLWKPPDTGIVAVIKEHAAPCLVFDSSDLVLPKWPDGIHPNNDGGAIWAEKFWTFYEANQNGPLRSPHVP